MRKDGRETRHNVIEKSLQIFSVKGYYNTSISDIMAATGMTKGGLYAHFDTRVVTVNGENMLSYSGYLLREKRK